ncbi:MAG: DUF11 domain-containing protein, partial [Verrucomicrobiales bacterium]|nr:DUF11 domain-containing protein [Verrucomicrobiales bacterium]
NQGSVAAKNILLVDYIPSGLVLDDPNWVDAGNGTALGGFGATFSLNPGASVTANIRFKVATGTAEGPIQNVAEIRSARDPDGNIANDTDSVADVDRTNDGFMIDNAINNENFDEDDSDLAIVSVNPPEAADLALRKRLYGDQCREVKPGDKVCFEMEVFNQGALPATDIKVCDYLPTGMTFDQVDNPFWTLETASRASCTLTGPLEPGASAQIVLCLRVDPSVTTQINGNGSILNYAEICSFQAEGPNGVIVTEDADSTPDNILGNDGQVTDNAINGENFDEDDMDCERINILPPDRFDLALRKTLASGCDCQLFPGGEVCYSLEIFNQGAVDAYNVKVCDYVPSGLTFSSASNQGWVQEAPGRLVCVLPGPIPAGGSFAAEVCFTVSENAALGSTITNCAEICEAFGPNGAVVTDFDSTPDSNPDNDGKITDNAINGENFDEDDHDCEEITIVEQPRFDLAVRHYVAPGQPGTVNAGGTITLNTEVFNQGLWTAESVTLHLCIPDGFEVVSSPGWSVAGSGATFTLGAAIAPGSSVIVPVTLRSTLVSASGADSPVTSTVEILSAVIGGAPIMNDVDSLFDDDCTNDGFIVDDEINNANGDEDDSDIALIYLTIAPALGDCVWVDSNNNGILDNGEVGLEGVTVRLLNQFGNPTGITATTGPDGNYLFDSLPPGDYCVLFELPAGYAFSAANQGGNDELDSDADPVTGRTQKTTLEAGEIDRSWDAGVVLTGSIGDYVWMDTNANGVQDPDEQGLSGVTICLLDAAGQDVDDPNQLGTQPYVVVSGSNGAYLFTNVKPGTYTLLFKEMAGLVHSAPDQGGNDATDSDADETGLTSVVTLNPGETKTDVDAGYRLLKTDWESWLATQPGTGGNANADTDGDGYTSLAEFAFCLMPDSGILHKCPLELVVQDGVGRIDACVTRVEGAPEVKVVLEYVGALENTPNGWAPVTLASDATSNGDGTETVCWRGLEVLPGMGDGSGFVRARVTLDTNHDGTAEATAYSDVQGWNRRHVEYQCETISHPFLKCDIYQGMVSSVGGSTLQLGNLGSESIESVFQPGRSYYIEVTMGDHEGHRFEVNEAASSGTTLVLDTASPLNTLTTVPSTLQGDSIALREHWTYNDAFPPARFSGTNASSTSDRLLIYNGSGYDQFWLYPNRGNHRWVSSADATLNDVGVTLLPPCHGLFVHPRVTSVDLILFGGVRANKAACPLGVAGTMLGNAWPMDQSPNDLGMSAANGFTGAPSASASDKIRIWRGDTILNAEGFFTSYLLGTATRHYWTSEEDASLMNQNDENLFRATRAVFMMMKQANPDLMFELPWAP